MALLHNEKELLQRVALGDEGAYHELFNHLWPNVYSSALRLTKSPELAQDLSQEVLLRIWERRADLAKIANIYGFVYTITRNLVADFLRKKIFRNANLPFLINYFQFNENDPFSNLELAEQKQQLRKAINKLPEQLRTAITLAYYEGKSHKEIAAIMKITPASSRIYLVRTLAILRKDASVNNFKSYLKLLWVVVAA